MHSKEFEEVKEIALDMKDSGQTIILTPTSIVMVIPTVEVIVAQKSAQAPIVPYAIVT